MSKNVKGLTQLMATLKKMPGELDDKVNVVLEASAREIARDAALTAPKDLGKLQQSIRAILVDSKTAVIRANATGLAPYAAFVEYGTAPHKIRAKNKPFLVFRGKDGALVYVKEVNHPGTKAQPFLMPAFLKGRKSFTKRLQTLLDRYFKSQ